MSEYKTLQENQTLNLEYQRNKELRELKQEIERLNMELSKTYENGLNDFLELQKKIAENERLENIIKEVREYIGSKEHYEDDFDTEIEKVYKILDRVGDKE